MKLIELLRLINPDEYIGIKKKGTFPGGLLYYGRGIDFPNELVEAAEKLTVRDVFTIDNSVMIQVEEDEQ